MRKIVRMRKSWIAALAGVVGSVSLSGCATPTASDGTPLPTAITFSPSVCYGSCPDYSVTVRADGTGTWQGRNFVAVKGERQFTLSDAQYRTFAAKIAPYRPAGERNIVPDTPFCKEAATDMPTTTISWTQGEKIADKLVYYHGCDMADNRAMADTLRTAPDILPLSELIGPRDITKP